MDTFEYDCDYCGKKFRPRRRYVQRFCSTSCRVGSHNRKKKLIKQPVHPVLPEEKEKEKKGINITGIAEAGIGTLAVDTIKTLLTRPEDRPATKADLKAVVERIEKLIRPEQAFPPLSHLPKPSPTGNKEESNAKSGLPWA